MKAVYPVIFSPLEEGYMAYVPDMEINTQGDSLAEAIAMARDAIGLMGIDMEDDGKELPKPSRFADIQCKDEEVISMVDIDFSEYRKKHEQRTVRRNVSVPGWLDDAATKAGINVSAVLQKALKDTLNLHDR